jgi:hypothetical protein
VAIAVAWEPENAADLFSEIWTLFNRGELIPSCAWCGRVRIAETWAFPPKGALDAIDARLSTSHSICPSCVQTTAAIGAQQHRQIRGPEQS